MKDARCFNRIHSRPISMSCFRSSDSAKNKTYSHTIAFVYLAKKKKKNFFRCSNEFYIINILMMTALRMVWIFLTSDTSNENRPRQLL